MVKVHTTKNKYVTVEIVEHTLNSCNKRRSSAADWAATVVNFYVKWKKAYRKCVWNDISDVWVWQFPDDHRTSAHESSLVKRLKYARLCQHWISNGWRKTAFSNDSYFLVHQIYEYWCICQEISESPPCPLRPLPQKMLKRVQ